MRNAAWGAKVRPNGDGVRQPCHSVGRTNSGAESWPCRSIRGGLVMDALNKAQVNEFDTPVAIAITLLGRKDEL